MPDEYVMVSEVEPGVAKMTVHFADDDHQFEVSTDGTEAVVEYQETRTYRGNVIVAEPFEEVYRILMTSEEMTAFLDETGATGVRKSVHI